MKKNIDSHIPYVTGKEIYYLKKVLKKKKLINIKSAFDFVIWFWKFKSTNRACIITEQPRIQAIRMKNMTTWHEHAFHLQLNQFNTYCACWWLKYHILFSAIYFLFVCFIISFQILSDVSRRHLCIFAMLFFYLNNSQLFDSILTSFI